MYDTLLQEKVNKFLQFVHYKHEICSLLLRKAIYNLAFPRSNIDQHAAWDGRSVGRSVGRSLEGGSGVEHTLPMQYYYYYYQTESIQKVQNNDVQCFGSWRK